VKAWAIATAIAWALQKVILALVGDPVGDSGPVVLLFVAGSARIFLYFVAPSWLAVVLLRTVLKGRRTPGSTGG
jgi:hypothetical protein